MQDPDQFIDRPPISRWRRLIRDPAPAPRTVPRMVCLDFLPPTAYRPAKPPPRAPKIHAKNLTLTLCLMHYDWLLWLLILLLWILDNVVADMNHKDVNNNSYVEMLHHILHDCECNLHYLEYKIHRQLMTRGVSFSHLILFTILKESPCLCFY